MTNYENLDTKKELRKIMTSVSMLRDGIHYKKVLNPKGLTATDEIIERFLQNILHENVKVSDEIYHSNPFTFYAKVKSEEE